MHGETPGDWCSAPESSNSPTLHAPLLAAPPTPLLQATSEPSQRTVTLQHNGSTVPFQITMPAAGAASAPDPDVGGGKPAAAPSNASAPSQARQLPTIFLFTGYNVEGAEYAQVCVWLGGGAHRALLPPGKANPPEQGATTRPARFQ